MHKASTDDGSSDNDHRKGSELLLALLASLDAAKVRYAVIHHATDIDSQIESDIDLVLDRHPAAVLDPLLAAFPNVRVVHSLHYEIPFGFYYILTVGADPACFLHLDVTFDPWGCNHYLYTSEELLAGRRQRDGVWTTGAVKEAAYLLIKKSIKGGIDADTCDLIRARLNEDPEKGRDEVSRWFGTDGMELVERLLAAGGTPEGTKLLGLLRTRLRGHLFLRGGLFGLRRIYFEARRRLFRVMRPTGMFVVVIGPDGSGKSTLVGRALTDLARGFRATWRFHWRPGLLPKPAAGAADSAPKPATPPAEYTYGFWMSLARYLYYLTDFILGYWIVIYPRKVRTTLVFGERWYYDVLVNPQRYGFRLPAWLLRFGGRLVPKPDLAVLLEAPPNEIHARKPELSVNELHEQLQKMRAVLPYFGCRVRTAGSIDKSATELARVVLDRTQDRAAGGRNKPSLGADQWRAFPKAGNVKLWIHGRDPIRNALHLYHPYSWVGRTVIQTLAYLPRGLTTRLLPPPDEHRLQRLAGAIRGMLKQENLIISFSTGTPTAHRKITAQVSQGGKIVAYVKIGSSDAAKKLMQAEAEALNRLDRAALDVVISVPRVLAQSAVDDYFLLALSAPPVPGKQRSTALDERDIRFLASLAPSGSRVEPLSRILEAMALGQDGVARQGHPEVMTHACETVAALLKNGVRMAPAHGDYVPWNTLSLKDGSLYVFDWEHAAEAPLLGDFFHRVFMPDRLVNGGIPPHAAMRRLLGFMNASLIRPLMEKFEIRPEEYPAYVLLYFLQLAVRETHEKGGIDRYLEECFHLVLMFAGHPAHRIRVLVSAYACEPHKGSEPGVGWGWVQEISRDHETWVITRENNREIITAELRAHPNPHLHVEYVDLPAWARFWKRKQRGVRTYYYLWQFAAWRRARKLHPKVNFDVAHHVTFVNDWLWTFLALMPLPYAWGPIGSNARCPPQLLPHRRARRADALRITVQNLVRWLDPLWWISAVRAAAVITINQNVANMAPLRRIAGRKTRVEPAIAIDVESNAGMPPARDGTRILYVGRHLAVKGGALAVESFAKAAARHRGARLTMIGEGPEEKDLRARAQRHGMADRVDFLPWQTQEQVWRAMETADVFLFPSMEGAGMVVLEAMRAGLPVVCLDFGGPGTMVTDATGCRVPVGSFTDVTGALAMELIGLLNDPMRRRRLGEAGRRRAREMFSWEAKRASIFRLYRDAFFRGKAGQHVDPTLWSLKTLYKQP